MARSPHFPLTRRARERMVLALVPLLWALWHTAGGSLGGGVDRLDALLQDARMRLAMPHTLDTRVVIVDVDDRSLAEIGPWPWRGESLTRLAHELFDRQQVSVVGFDLVFEPPGPSHAAEFARALQQQPVVLGYHLRTDADAGHAGVLPAPVIPAQSLQGRAVRVHEGSGYTASIEPMARAVPTAGFVDMVSDADTRVRAIPLLARYQGDYYETLALAMFRVMTGHPSVEPVFPPVLRYPARHHGLESLRLRVDAQAIAVPVGDGVTVPVPFRGPGGASGGAFRYIRAADLIAGRIPAGTLQGQAVVVGSTASHLSERFITPVGTDYPRAELHASLLSGLLEERVPVRPDYASGYGLLVLVGAGMLLALLLPVLSWWRGWALYAAVMAGIVGLNLWLFLAADLLLPLAPALLMATAIFSLSLGYGGWVEHRARRELSSLLGRTAPRELVQALVDDPRESPARAVRRPMTVMFCEIRGLATLAEQMNPTALQAMLHRLWSCLGEVIEVHHGTLGHVMGGSVVAFWGAPQRTSDHARQSAEAAFSLLRAMDAFNEAQRPHGLPSLSLGIGLNTGVMCVGDLGSRTRRAYTVIGDAVDLAARLQALSAAYGVAVLAGEATRRDAQDFTWQEVDRVRWQGVAQAVTLFTPRVAQAGQEKALTEELRTWEAFLKADRLQDAETCEQILAGLRRQQPQSVLYGLYARRLEVMRGCSRDPVGDGADVIEPR